MFCPLKPQPRLDPAGGTGLFVKTKILNYSNLPGPEPKRNALAFLANAN
jgi:hypothetical protein